MPRRAQTVIDRTIEYRMDYQSYSHWLRRHDMHETAVIDRTQRRILRLSTQLAPVLRTLPPALRRPIVYTLKSLWDDVEELQQIDTPENEVHQEFGEEAKRDCQVLETAMRQPVRADASGAELGS